jgi:hypothetical protein
MFLDRKLVKSGKEPLSNLIRHGQLYPQYGVIGVGEGKVIDGGLAGFLEIPERREF